MFYLSNAFPPLFSYLHFQFLPFLCPSFRLSTNLSPCPISFSSLSQLSLSFIFDTSPIAFFFSSLNHVPFHSFPSFLLFTPFLSSPFCSSTFTFLTSSTFFSVILWHEWPLFYSDEGTGNLGRDMRKTQAVGRS